MNSVDIMMQEHQLILEMVQVIRKMCFGIYQGAKPDAKDFDDVMDFVKNYADAHHHGKEEEYLFRSMVDHLGKIGQNLITHGMLVEHDLGRMYMMDLREALSKYFAGDEESILDVIANVISYTHMIERHIKKEDELVYPYGVEHLPREVFQEVEKKTFEFEKKADEQGTQKHYVDMVQRLAEKYHAKR